MVPPGATIGILGGGQLGRMLAIAAARLGYRTHIYAPEESGPAADVCACWVRGDYDDADRVAEFARAVSLVTFEFENVPLAAVERLAGLAAVHPPARALAVSQDRADEKRFVESLGGAVAPWRPVDGRPGLDTALAAICTPAILKTRRFGYDGKGQARIDTAADADAAWAAIGGAPAVLEGMVAFDAEFSVIVARRADGMLVTYPPTRNEHRGGILHRSVAPATGIPARLLEAAAALTARIADALDYVGVLAVEFFADGEDPILNEMAPRVHNSGHWTIEGAATSQFENHIRAICGLPLGPTSLTGRSAEMLNLIGDDIDAWPRLLAEPGAHLHHYGKHDARPGRKMAHVTRVTVAR
ncbi:5-(carboxyamino)imidazole ribonucleotide synthase [Sphingomonas jejuensis]|uniref:N5-carboxyaminoimidazole ribonucleotide synthase n=1 Tax=Sphingomonas jejuensis TaxID=904715 RepID=A0ABX0XPC2_9SPHN|nr:5-(carboxyamino)imidazole ribonucleotide synthase [Sphingomonas jejuensis]NJC34536.1 5-(carboxyamino)imidazole ribonucleotide synthase [Sphingomonas jejuensis]